MTIQGEAEVRDATALSTSSAGQPLYAILLAGMVPLFLGAFFADLAYSSSFEIQWKNFASWLLVGALVFAGFAMLWTVLETIRLGRRGPRVIALVVLLLGAWLVGFFSALVHAKDSWASMPAALFLSGIATILAIGAALIGLSPSRREASR